MDSSKEAAAAATVDGDGVVYVVPQARVHRGPIFAGWRDDGPALPARQEDLRAYDDAPDGMLHWGICPVRTATPADARFGRHEAWHLWMGRPVMPVPAYPGRAGH